MKLAIDEHKVNTVAEILSEETLHCPPPYDFTMYESMEEAKECPAKDSADKNPCAECWKRWLLNKC